MRRICWIQILHSSGDSSQKSLQWLQYLLILSMEVSFIWRNIGRFSFKVIHRLILRQGRSVNRESPLKLKRSLVKRFFECHSPIQGFKIVSKSSSCNCMTHVTRPNAADLSPSFASIIHDSSFHVPNGLFMSATSSQIVQKRVSYEHLIDKKRKIAIHPQSHRKSRNSINNEAKFEQSQSQHWRQDQ